MISLIKPSGLTRCGVNATEPTKLAPVVMERFGHSAHKECMDQATAMHRYLSAIDQFCTRPSMVRVVERYQP